MSTRKGRSPWIEVLPGIRRRTLAWGERTLMAAFRLEAGAALPAHDHPHEQTGYLVSGRLRMTVGGDVRELGPGDAWLIPGHTVHAAEALENALAIEVFSPPREDYLS